MKIKKTVSQKVINANRANALVSSGAKSRSGRKNSSRNALTSGFFARELVLTNEEEAEVQALRRALRGQLQPTTVLQGIGLEEVVCCCFRCKLAMRQEMRRLSAVLAPKKDQEVQPEGTTVPVPARWYADNRQDLRSATRWLENVSKDFQENGVVREDWKGGMDSAFGPDFYEALVKWSPMNPATILVAQSLEMHAKLYGQGNIFPGEAESSKVTMDPNQAREMVGKLLQQQLGFLNDMYRWKQRASESAGAQNAATVDFAPRYFTTASRDLHRAVNWYNDLKQNDL